MLKAIPWQYYEYKIRRGLSWFPIRQLSNKDQMCRCQQLQNTVQSYPFPLTKRCNDPTWKNSDEKIKTVLFMTTIYKNQIWQILTNNNHCTTGSIHAFQYEIYINDKKNAITNNKETNKKRLLPFMDVSKKNIPYYLGIGISYTLLYVFRFCCLLISSS